MADFSESSYGCARVVTGEVSLLQEGAKLPDRGAPVTDQQVIEDLQAELEQILDLQDR